MIEHLCPTCDGTGDENCQANIESLLDGMDAVPYVMCNDCNGVGKLGEGNPLLEEYVDCLHFILSIGNDLEVDINKCRIDNYKNDTVIEQFKDMFNVVCDLHDDKTDIQWSIVIGFYLGLGEMLGFYWEQITDAYYAKNAINHQRQTDKY